MTDPINRLLEILDTEHALLLRADVNQVAALADAKTRAVKALGTLAQNTDLPDLEKLRLRARRNDRIMRAVLSGLKSSRERLENLYAGRSAPLETYNKTGTQNAYRREAGKLEKRA